MTKEDCIDFFVRDLAKTSNWRRQQAKRWPDDSRNDRASARLIELAANATDISDRQWDALRPFFDLMDPRWIEAVGGCSRDVGFRTHPCNFAEYVQTVIDAVAVSA